MAGDIGKIEKQVLDLGEDSRAELIKKLVPKKRGQFQQSNIYASLKLWLDHFD